MTNAVVTGRGVVRISGSQRQTDFLAQSAHGLRGDLALGQYVTIYPLIDFLGGWRRVLYPIALATAGSRLNSAIAAPAIFRAEMCSLSFSRIRDIGPAMAIP